MTQEISEKHSELFHYTSKQGLIGILKSQCLWATHYKHLNDATEFQLMRTEMVERLFPFLKQMAVKHFRSSGIKTKNRMRKAGGPIKIARQEAEVIVKSFYEASFGETEYGSPIMDPFITSFCAHTDDKIYEIENGLLSQWRGYSEEGGYAIVFDAAKLCNSYSKDEQRYDIQFLQIGDVVYQGDEEVFEENFNEGIQKILEVHRNFLETGQWGVGEMFNYVLSMFSRLKHRAFFEEREVRSIVIPMTADAERQYKMADPNYVSPDKLIKPIQTRADGVPYIEMLGDIDTPLPIKRIIVGPQTNQAQAVKEIQHLVGKDVEIRCSETPLK